jgi:hypothetical protein
LDISPASASYNTTLKSPVEIPLRYNVGINASMLAMRRINGGRIVMKNESKHNAGSSTSDTLCASGIQMGEANALPYSELMARGSWLRALLQELLEKKGLS